MAFRRSSARFRSVPHLMEVIIKSSKRLVKFLEKYPKNMAIRVSIDMNVAILFGLELFVFCVINITKEAFMISSFVVQCVWCEVTFLRSPGGVSFQSIREINILRNSFLIHEKRREVRVLSFAPFLY